MMRVRVSPRSEAGVSLVLVLATLVIFGLLVPVLGQFGAANGISGYIVKGQRYDRYAADNGMNAAIAWARDRRTAGRELVDCPGITTHITGPARSADRDVTVKCRGFKGSGTPVGNGSTPAFAVLALNPAQHAIDIDSSGRLKTNGAWWADGDPGQTSADLHRVQIDASADLFGATGSCHLSNGAQLFAAPEQCDAGLRVEDPGYAPSLTSLDGVHADPVLDCTAIRANGVLALDPVIHWDASFLTQVALGRCTSHRNVVIWLKPGVHYFDFDFYDPSSSSAWTIGGSGSRPVVVIGGTPRGWNPDGAGDQVAAARAAATKDNAAKASGACELGAEGVELVLGSRSHVAVRSPANVELCPARTDPSAQHLVVTGPRSGAAGAAIDVPSSTPRRAAPVAASGFTWPAALPAPPAPNPLAQEDCGNRGSCDRALFQAGELRGRSGTSGTVSMLVPNRIPENARIQTLQLDVRHREPITDNGASGTRDQIDGLSAVLTGFGVDARCDDIRPSENWTTDRVTCRLARPVPAPDPATVPDLGVELTFTTGGGDNNAATEQLDYVAVRANVTRAAVRAEQCPDTRCRVIDIDNRSGGGSVFVWGTIALPIAAVHEDFGGQTSFKLARGVVADAVQLEGLPSSATFVPIELPNGGIYRERFVTFEAFLGASRDPVLSARVRFPDPVDGIAGVPSVDSWNPHRR